MNQVEQSLEIPAAGVTLAADLAVPARAAGLVLFAHGSGSSRHSSRNRYVARELQNAGLATALADLLTPERSGPTPRAASTVSTSAGCRCGLSRSPTGCWDTMPRPVSVSDCSGPARVRQPRWSQRRRDLSPCRPLSRAAAGPTSRRVPPTGLSTDTADRGRARRHGIERDRDATQVLPVETRLEIVPGATHLFEEPGALEQAARCLARDWFLRHLLPPHAARAP